jgi:signal peptidase I
VSSRHLNPTGDIPMAVNRVALRAIDAALVVLLVFSLALLSASVLLPALDRQLLIINSGSMAPAMPTGSIIIVNHDRGVVEAGEAVTIRTSSGVVFTHRVVEVIRGQEEPLLLTQGDANPHPDPTTYPLSSVVGVVEASVPEVGRAVAFAQSDAGRMLLVATLLLLLALRWFWNDLFGPARAAEPLGQPTGEPSSQVAP